MNKMDLESQIAKFFELKREIELSMENLKKLDKQYENLANIVKESGKENDLPEGFVDSLFDTKAHNAEQLELLSQRMVYIDAIVEMYNKQDDEAAFLERIVTLVFAALGIMGETKEVAEEESK